MEMGDPDWDKNYRSLFDIKCYIFGVSVDLWALYTGTDETIIFADEIQRGVDAPFILHRPDSNQNGRNKSCQVNIVAVALEYTEF